MPPNIGDPAPPFSGTIHGTNTTFNLQDYQGQVVLVAFSGLTWCGPCQYEAPILQDAWESFKGCYNVQFVMVHGTFIDSTFDTELAKLSDAIDDYGITFPVIADNAIWDLYGIGGVPKLFIIGPDQTICATKVGAGGTPDEIRHEIRSLVFGCGATKSPWCLDTSRWLAVGYILFGITEDGGGVIISGGRPIPVPPWDPLRRDALVALAINELATDVRDRDARKNIQSSALDVLERTTASMRLRANRPPLTGPALISAPRTKGK
jgi:peroxiredoxin